MKMPQQMFQVMKNSLELVIKHYGGPEEIRKLQEERSWTINAMRWKLFDLAHHDLQYDDTHPAYVNGRKRIVNQDPSFKMYDHGLNDSHIETALKKACKELGFSEEKV